MDELLMHTRMAAINSADETAGIVMGLLYIGDQIENLTAIKPLPAPTPAPRSEAFLALMDAGFGQVDADKALDAIAKTDRYADWGFPDGNASE